MPPSHPVETGTAKSPPPSSAAAIQSSPLPDTGWSSDLGTARFVGNPEVDPRDVRVNTIRIRLGHESLDVTLAYLKGKDAESEEAQEHANSSSLALYA